jgi:D-alanyl-D-alanine carboxypeptidase
MLQGAAAAGAGELALGSAFRSYETQQSTYSSQVGARGVEGADLVSARPGYSEHQSGLAGDVLPCNGGCGTIDDLDASPQGAWVKAHAWEYGFIVRYTEGKTDVTGYIAEPWHLRYVGPELAAEYTAGGWQSLEEFFGLPAAPQYLG